MIFLSCELDKIKVTNEEVDRIWEILLDRGKWRTLKKKYRRLTNWLKKAEEIAKEASRKTGIKITFDIPSPEEGDRFYFIASFNSKGMSDEEKLRMIGKALDAVEEAQGRV